MVTAVVYIVGLFSIIPAILLMRWYLKRNHVWIDIELREGRSVRKLLKPKDGQLETPWGSYLLDPYRFTMYRGRPLYRFREGDPRPHVYAVRKVVSANPGEVKEIVSLEPVTIPSKMIATAMRQRVFAQIYERGAGQILIVALLVIILLVLVGVGLRG
jgi:hypothetical protein